MSWPVSAIRSAPETPSSATAIRSSMSVRATSIGRRADAAITGATTRPSISTATASPTAYRPNDLVDRVLWTAPSAKVLINSPAVQVLRWAQAQFPALYPGGVVDSHPLIAPPPRPSSKEAGK